MITVISTSTMMLFAAAPLDWAVCEVRCNSRSLPM